MVYVKAIIDEAKELRRNGSTLGEIASKFSISKSTASLWTSKETVSKRGMGRILERQNLARKRAFLTISKRRNLVQEKIMKKAKISIKKIDLSSPSLCKLLASIFLWTEGEKGSFRNIGFTNSDPLMVSTFLKLLRNSFRLDETKFRALVHIHEYHNEKKVIAYWTKITKIPISQFTKSYLKSHTAKRKKVDYMGCIRISYYDYKVARELASVYNMFANEFRGVG